VAFFREFTAESCRRALPLPKGSVGLLSSADDDTGRGAHIISYYDRTSYLLILGFITGAMRLVHQPSRHLSVLVQTETPPTILLQQYKKMLAPGRVALGIAFDIAGVCAHLCSDPTQHRCRNSFLRRPRPSRMA
jgi:hypothetical protein